MISGMFLTVSFPPTYGMGKIFKKHKGDLFTVGKILDEEITL
jgi:hypothetical protein